IVRGTRAPSRGVRQAPLLVLSGTRMPSALVEIGFISHPREGRMLGGRTYQAKVAQALADGVRAFADKVLARRLVAQVRSPAEKGSGRGWVTAEYGMLPRSTHTRSDREAAKGKQSGRTQEIQRLIGRALRAAVDLQTLGERQVLIDCDVLQADGGTRTAAITGGYAALGIALRRMQRDKALRAPVAAISVGILAGQALLDLDYEEDFAAEVDMNVVGNAAGELLEVQGTAEKRPFTP